MSIEDLKVKPEILSPKPPSIATDEEFASGTSTTASPTVKQAKENLVSIDTTQTITGRKVFTTEQLRKSTNIDVTSKATSTTFNTLVRFRDKNNKELGAVNNAQINGGIIRTVLEARNKDNYVPTIGVQAPYEGSTGGFGYAPNTPDNAPGNAIVTKDKIANMVTTNTSQTITGFKAFNSGSGNNRTNIDIITNDGVAEDANSKWAGSIQFKKGNMNVGYCEAMKDSANSSITQIVAHNSVNGQKVYASLRSVATSDGNTFAMAPTPPVNSVGAEIVTAGWFNSKMQVVSALPANPDPNVFYFIPG